MTVCTLYRKMGRVNSFAPSTSNILPFQPWSSVQTGFSSLKIIHSMSPTRVCLPPRSAPLPPSPSFQSLAESTTQWLSIEMVRSISSGKHVASHRFDNTPFRFQSLSLLLLTPSNTPLKLPATSDADRIGSQSRAPPRQRGNNLHIRPEQRWSNPRGLRPVSRFPSHSPTPAGARCVYRESLLCGVRRWDLFPGPFSRSAKTESPSRIFRVNSLSFLSLRIQKVLCFDGFDVLLTQDGRLFGFRTTSAGNPLFPSSLPMGCLHALLPEQVEFRPLR